MTTTSIGLFQPEKSGVISPTGFLAAPTSAACPESCNKLSTSKGHRKWARLEVTIFWSFQPWLFFVGSYCFLPIVFSDLKKSCIMWFFHGRLAVVLEKHIKLKGRAWAVCFLIRLRVLEPNPDPTHSNRKGLTKPCQTLLICHGLSTTFVMLLKSYPSKDLYKIMTSQCATYPNNDVGTVLNQA